MGITTILLRRGLLLLAFLSPGLLSAQNWQWVAVNTAPASVNVRSGCTATAVDAAGNAIVAGFFTGTVVLGGLSLTSGGGASDDLFVARFNPAGACIQAVAIHAQGAIAHIRALAVDPTGTVVVGGETQGTLQFNATLSASAPNGSASFVARMNSTGTWTQVVTGGRNSQINGLVLDPQGNAWVTGFFIGDNTAFGGMFLDDMYSTRNRNLFMARLSAGGTWTQAVQSTGMGNCEGTAIALNRSGNPVVAGTFAGTPVTFGATTLGNAGGTSGNTGTDIVVARLNGAGAWTQAVSAGGPDSDTANAIAVDASGTAVVTGVVQAAGTFGAISPLQQYLGGYVARLSAGGAWLQATTYPVFSFAPQKLVLTPSGTVWVAAAPGIFRVTATGQWSDVADLRSGGNSHTVGGFGQAPNGELVLTGQLGGSASFGNLSVNPDARSMYFAARLSGAILATKSLATATQLNLYPQPAHDFVTLTGGSGMVRIYNLCGQEVRRFSATAANEQVNVSGLPVGIYMIQAGAATKRLVVN